jgi:Ca2+:H+ antiporter
MRNPLQRPPVVWTALALVGLASPILAATGGPELVVAGLAALGLLPMAALIGRATEELTHFVGPRLGGLLNATFGNAAELIIAFAALREGLTTLVKASITGSIIGNSLLVLGISLVAGGLRARILSFDPREAGRHSALMLLAVAALLFPAVFAFTNPQASLEPLSDLLALVLLAAYGAYLVFLVTEGVPQPSHAPEGRWSLTISLVALAVSTSLTVLFSELLVARVEGVIQSIGLSELFVGVMLIPIVGNIAEHFSAVQFAYRGKLDTTLAIAAGSSTQIALFVAPLLVLMGLVLGLPMTLLFHPLEIAVLVGSVAIFAFICLDGESNWLEGVMLLGLYAMAGAAFFLSTS